MNKNFSSLSWNNPRKYFPFFSSLLWCFFSNIRFSCLRCVIHFEKLKIFIWGLSRRKWCFGWQICRNFNKTWNNISYLAEDLMILFGELLAAIYYATYVRATRSNQKSSSMRWNVFLAAFTTSWFLFSMYVWRMKLDPPLLKKSRKIISQAIWAEIWKPDVIIRRIICEQVVIEGSKMFVGKFLRRNRLTRSWEKLNFGLTLR